MTQTTTYVKQKYSGESNNNHRLALVSLTSLFFMWGFITCLNDILIPHLKAVFDLNYTQAMMVQFCFFGAYFLVSLPAGKLIKRIGFQNGIVTGLLVAAIGCLLFYPAASLLSYPVFLFALFVLASGITLLQVSANPYVSILGKQETASSRLTMTQAFNSLGTTIAPFFGAILILEEAIAVADKTTKAEAVQIPYLMLAAMLFILAAIFTKFRLPKPIEQTISSPQNSASFTQALKHKHLALGAIAIFLYVGAEVAIGSFLISFFEELNIPNVSEENAAKYIAYYWGGAMVGRFIGAAVMQKVAAGKVLTFNAIMAAILVALAMVGEGYIAMWAILLVGLCNSIMFPTIFSLAITGLKEITPQGSAILCLSIVGGAIIPLIQGAMADLLGIQAAFVIPILCYAFIAYYGVDGSKCD